MTLISQKQEGKPLPYETALTGLLNDYLVRFLQARRTVWGPPHANIIPLLWSAYLPTE
jgi:hypothetical protein